MPKPLATRESAALRFKRIRTGTIKNIKASPWFKAMSGKARASAPIVLDPKLMYLRYKEVFPENTISKSKFESIFLALLDKKKSKDAIARELNTSFITVDSINTACAIRSMGQDKEIAQKARRKAGKKNSFEFTDPATTKSIRQLLAGKTVVLPNGKTLNGSKMTISEIAKRAGVTIGVVEKINSRGARKEAAKNFIAKKATVEKRGQISAKSIEDKIKRMLNEKKPDGSYRYGPVFVANHFSLERHTIGRIASSVGRTKTDNMRASRSNAHEKALASKYPAVANHIINLIHNTPFGRKDIIKKALFFAQKSKIRIKPAELELVLQHVENTLRSSVPDETAVRFNEIIGGVKGFNHEDFSNPDIPLFSSPFFITSELAVKLFAQSLFRKEHDLSQVMAKTMLSREEALIQRKIALGSNPYSSIKI